MQAKKFTAIFMIIFLGAVLCFAQKEEKRKEEETAKKISDATQVKSLIMKDLLSEKKEKLRPPKRNIFSPRMRSNPEVKLSPEEVQRKLEEVALKSEENPPEIFLDISYIGYINSGHKIIALIIFEEEAIAVEEGEVISLDVKVGKVSTKKIEIIGPDSKKREFRLEGEER